MAPAEAFGFLVPSSSSKSTPLLGAVFDSCAFPPSNGNTIFTVMMGGRWFSSTLGDFPSLGRVQDLAVENLQRIIKHDKAPVRYVTFLDIGLPTGNGKKLSCSQAQLGQETGLAVA